MATVSASLGRTAGRLPRVGLPRWWAAWLLTGVLALLVLYPLLQLALVSVQAGGPVGADHSLTLSHFARVFSAAETYQLLWTTLWLAVARVALATLVAVFLAWAIARTDMPGRRAVEWLLWVQFFMPPLPVLIAWTLLGSRNGLVNYWLKALPFVNGPIVNIYSYGGIIWVSTLSLAAFIFLLLLPAFKTMDATLEEAASTSGVSGLRVLRHVTVPLLLPTILGAVFLAFIYALESFETELLLGTPSRIYVLSTQIFIWTQEYPQDLSAAATMSLVFLTSVSAMILVQTRLLRGKSFTTISGKRFSARVTPLGPWKWLVLAVVAVYLGLGMALPLGTLVLGSFMRSWGIWDFSRPTLINWQQQLGDPRLVAAVGNTVMLGVLVGLFGTLAAALAAYVVVRTKFRGRPLLEFVTWAPRVAPGVVLALAFLWAYLARLPFPNPLAGTLGIMALVVTVNALPVSARMMSGAMHQVSAELEEAGRVGGATWTTVFRHIMAPLLAPALTTCFVLLFLSAIRNLVLVVFFYTPSTRVLASIFWEAWTGNFPQRALVSGFLMMLLSLAALTIASLLGRRSSIAGV